MSGTGDGEAGSWWREEGRRWGERARDWADLQEPFNEPFFRVVLDRVSITSGTRLLDVGCGAGMALRMAADRGASVTGLDASASLLAIARERVPDGDLRLGQVEDLPFPDDSFDVVTGFNSFTYAEDPVRALREARRVTRPDGHVGAVVWGGDDRCQLWHVFLAVLPLLPPEEAAEALPRSLSPAEELAELVRDAGLEAPVVGEVDTPVVYRDLAMAERALFSGGWPSVMAIEHTSEEIVRDALRRGLEPFRRADGSYRMENVFLYAIARA